MEKDIDDNDEICIGDKVVDDLSGAIATVVGISIKKGIVDDSKVHYLSAKTIVLTFNCDTTKLLHYRLEWEITKIPMVNKRMN